MVLLYEDEIEAALKIAVREGEATQEQAKQALARARARKAFLVEPEFVSKYPNLRFYVIRRATFEQLVKGYPTTVVCSQAQGCLVED